jgi:hypothetical protein
MRYLLALALPLVTSQPVLAQAQPSAAAIASATVLVDMLSPPATSKAALDQQLQGVRQGNMIRAQLGNNPRFREAAQKNEPGFAAAMARMGNMQADALGPIYAEMQAAVRTASIQAYATSFTIEELNAAAAFYRTATGAKLLRTQPQLAAQVNQNVQQQYTPRLQAAQQALNPKLEAELRALFPQQAAAPAPAPAKK